MSSSPSRLGTLAVGLLVGAAVAVALLAFVGPLQDLLPESGEQSRAAEAEQVIEDSYFRPTDSEDLQNASIDGMVKRISKENDDKFSHYFTAAQLKQFEAVTSGRYKGIGLAVTEVPKGLRISDVFPDTPAEDAGL